MQYTVIARDISVPLVKLILVIALVMLGLNAMNMMAVHVMGELIGCLVLLYFLHQVFPLFRSWRTARYQAKEMIRFCLPLYGSNLLGLFGGNLQTLLLGTLSTITSVGFFTVALRVNLLTGILQGGINLSAMPIVSMLYSQGEYKQLGDFYQITTKWLLAINLPFFLISVFFAKPILSIFGDDFIPGATILIILSCGSLVDAATGINSGMISMTGNTWLNTLNTAILLILSIVFILLLIPSLGAVGAAITTAACLSILNLVRTLEVFLLFRLLPYNKSFIKPIIAAMAAAVVTFVLGRWGFVESSLINAGFSAVLLLAIYLGVTLALGLSEADRAVLVRLSWRLKAMRPGWFGL